MVIVSHRVPFPFLAPPHAPPASLLLHRVPFRPVRLCIFYRPPRLLEDFSMMYPGSRGESYTDGGRAKNRTERPDMRGGPDHDFSDTRD
jgi:hypothetical protein